MLIALVASVQASAPNIRINEVYYDPPSRSADEHSEEFIELFVVNGGIDPSFWYINDWDNDPWEIPTSCPIVAAGEFIVIHIGSGTEDSEGPVYHFYMGETSGQLSNIGDPISLHEDNDSLHDRNVDLAHDFMTYEGGTDSDLQAASPWAGWPNDGVDPTDEGATAPENMGKSVQLLGEDLDNGSNWAAGPPTEGSANSLVPDIQWASSIADAKSLPDGTVVGVTATVHTPIGFLNYERRQFWLQDSTAGIVVDNTPELTTQSYSPGDVVCVTGTLFTSTGVRLLSIEGDPGDPVGTYTLEPFQTLTVEGFRDSVVDGTDEFQSELIRLSNVCFDGSSPSVWATDTSYRIRDVASAPGSATAYIRIEDGSELVGKPVPDGVSFTVQGEASRYYDYPRIMPRYVTDIIPSEATGIGKHDWEEYE